MAKKKAAKKKVVAKKKPASKKVVAEKVPPAKKVSAKKKVTALARVPKKRVVALPENAVRVPRPVKKSFNPKRPLHRNLLLANQVMHFHEIEKELPTRQRSGLALEDIKTEGQAADFIRHVTLGLHKQKKGNA